MAVIVTGVVFAVTARQGGLGDPSTLTTVLGFGVSVTGLAINLVRSSAADGSGPTPAERLSRYCDQLAVAVREQWQAEWRLRRLQDPDPLQVSWTLAEPWLADQWDDARDPTALDDRLEHITTVFSQVPAKRLVVLGGPGSGKTVLAVRFTLDVLQERQPGDPVPVIFSLSSWRPDNESLRGWMAASLAATYPGATWGGELLTANLVLPVLDGLDEIPEPLRAQAVRRLNAELDPGSPILLTCRTQVYAEEVETGDVFTSAAVAELQPLSFDDAGAYLVRTARPVRGADGQRTTRWDPVLTHVRAHSNDPPVRALRQVLETPLIVAMARSVYGEATADPAELLDPHFSDPAALEEHLLEAFVPAAFVDTPDADRACRWLGFLAAHLERHHLRDLAWWQLRLALPWPLRALGPILLLGILAMAISLTGVETAGPVLPVVTAAILAGVSIGYLVLSYGRTPTAQDHPEHERRIPRRLILALAITASLGVLVGSTGALSFPYGTFTPTADGWLNPAALAMTGGLATAMVLAVIGITGATMPSTASFVRIRRTTSHLHRTLSAAALLLFGCAAGLTAFIFIDGLVSPDTFIVWAPTALLITLAAATGLGVLSGLLTVRARRADPQARAAGLHGPAQDGRPRRRANRAMGRALATGLVAGFCLGAAFGLAEATALAIRADRQGDFPKGAVLHTLPDGTRYAVTPNGWWHGRLPDGGKFVRTPTSFHGIIAHDPDGSRYAGTASSAQDVCTGQTRCVPLHGPVEIHLRHGTYDDEQVKLPNGDFVDEYDIENELPSQTAQWLYAGDPGPLFRDATTSGLWAGLAIGVISGIAAGLHRWLITPVDITRALGPIASLRTDRTTAAARSIIVFYFGIITTAFVVTYMHWPDSTYYALLIWGLAGPLALILSAWGWLLTARLWLCGTGRLPWRLMTFLDESHSRGVLRQAGAVYQFRHAKLQEQLAITSNHQQD
ncbi:NACHT domain-containing protein [Streptomyces sp. NPDC000618]|uniref:NACHT domain-containing protein n=1 Tax=Streptomyces sp. NPDC000618 TaxID=3154265 RepID=UPI00331AE94D